MDSIKDLKGKYLMPIVIVGGGPSALEDLKRAPKSSLIISTNHHAYAAGLIPDFMVFIDDPKEVPQIKSAIERRNVESTKIISPRKDYSDYHLDINVWGGGDTGMKSCFLACYMTQGPVILCGIDCYQGDKRYFHDDVNLPDQFPRDQTKRYLIRWEKAFHPLQGCVDPKRIFASSGILTQIFPTWE